MAFYTKLTTNDLFIFLNNYDLGQLIYFEGISNGIQNSNYYIKTVKSEVILTIFENSSICDIKSITQLLVHLKKSNLPTPRPIKDFSGEVIRILCQKPAFLCSYLSGKSVILSRIEHCQQVGKYLAKLHKFTHGYSFTLQNNYNLTNLQLLCTELPLDSLDRKLVIDELLYQSEQLYSFLPAGVIHSDLFKDNVLFINEDITGIVDFHSACFEILIWDIAVAINDWCTEQGAQCSQKYHALLNEYNKVRPLTIEELNALPAVLRLTALRFWLSRIRYKQRTHIDSFVASKNPDEYKYLLIYYRQNANKMSSSSY